ncbi:MAG: iron complex transport system permease protein [Vicingaceae bacterium]|jgi:iron complex transport system permease protein
MKGSFIFTLLTIALILLVVADVLIGSVSIPLEDFMNWLKGEENSEVFNFIVLQSRIPKALTALLCGASLSLAGLLMQTLFRNPLAGPYLLGISSGAGLGVALLVMGAGVIGISLSSQLSFNAAAIGGSLAMMIILFVVSFKVKDIMTLLIFGVMMGSIATAIIGLIQFFTSAFQLKSFIIWTLGSLSAVSYGELAFLSVVLLSSSLFMIAQYKGLNAILIGEDFAKMLGINILSIRLSIIIVTGILAGLITAFCGPIGFVGIIIPHLARLVLKSNDHLLLIPVCLLLGANVLLLSDILAHLPADGTSLPINSITSIIGIPIILWIIFGNKNLSQTF